jgi:hypothetical protein
MMPTPTRPRGAVLAFATALALLAAPVARAESPPLSVPYVPTPQPSVERMLKLAGVGPEDVVYDLGSGDGRLVITAVQEFGARKGVGVDIDPARIKESKENARMAGVADRVSFVRGDLFDFDFSEADVLTLYLLPRVNMQLRPKILADLRPGARVVSHSFDMEDWEPDARDGELLMWVVPARVGGDWTWHEAGKPYGLSLRQEFQRLTGTLRTPEGEVPIERASVSGDQVRFEAQTGRTRLTFDGRVAEERLEGTATRNGQGSRVVASRTK